MSLKLSAHWSMGELSCRCACKGHLAPTIFANLTGLAVKVLEPLRLMWGRALTATCGYRCPAHNKKVGGVPGSEHTKGIAADLTEGDGLTDDEQIKLAALASQLPTVGGLGLYEGRGFVHVDTRPRKGGKITAWEQVDGRYVALRPETRKALLAAGARDLA